MSMSSSSPGNRISATFSPEIVLLSNGSPAIGARTSNAAAMGVDSLENK
jgi:hypothetical protein